MKFEVSAIFYCFKTYEPMFAIAVFHNWNFYLVFYIFLGGFWALFLYYPFPENDFCSGSSDSSTLFHRSLLRTSTFFINFSSGVISTIIYNNLFCFMEIETGKYVKVYVLKKNIYFLISLEFISTSELNFSAYFS